MRQRCQWAAASPVLQRYHDEVWGRPVFTDQELFESLARQIFQSGLKMQLVLTKLPEMASVMDYWQIDAIGNYSEVKVQQLLRDPLMIKNERKLRAVIHNAQVIQQMNDSQQSFSDWLWAQVGFVPLDLHQRTNAKVLVQHPVAKRVCQEMRKQGFTFIGPRNVSFFLQDAGLLNGHWINCAQRQAGGW
ncbi:DNA-3-methyladenine glycosylase I [Pediococcus acidilactici]